MTFIAHCLKKDGDRWVPAGGKPFRLEADAEAWAAEWVAEDPDNRAWDVRSARP